jgi:hypothetical protein
MKPRFSLWAPAGDHVGPNVLPEVGATGATNRYACTVFVQRCCKLCGEAFQIERRRGRPRVYCFVCEPPGWQVVKVPHQSRVKLRRRRAPLVRIG